MTSLEDSESLRELRLHTETFLYNTCRPRFSVIHIQNEKTDNLSQ